MTKKIKQRQEKEVGVEEEEEIKGKDNRNKKSGDLYRRRVLQRNDPCSCGSGRRYKKCCLPKEKNEMKIAKWKEKNGLQRDKVENKDTGSNESKVQDGVFRVISI